MRIAYLTSTYNPMAGSTAAFMSRLAEAMIAFRHQVLVITTSDKGHSYHMYKENLTLVRSSSIHNPFRVGQKRFFHPHRTIIKTLTQFQPDIIHSYASLQTGMSALLYAKRVNVPILLTMHSSTNPLPSGFFKPIIEKAYGWYASRVIRQYHALLVPTQTLETQLIRMTGCQTTSTLTEEPPSMDRLEKNERIDHKILNESGGRKSSLRSHRIKEKLISAWNNSSHS